MYDTMAKKNSKDPAILFEKFSCYNTPRYSFPEKIAMLQKMINRLQKSYESLLDIIFPKKCLSCQREGAWLCVDCKKHLRRRADQYCPLCEKKITSIGSVCLECRHAESLDGLFVALEYSDPLTKKMIHYFKYRFVREISPILSDVICDAMREKEFPLPDCIVPVPLHPRRLRWRGFNQSALIAQGIAETVLPHLAIPVAPESLVRVKFTTPQMRLADATLRRSNVSCAFQVIHPDACKGKRILLIDDVATTGSTIRECAKEFKKAGAQSVFAIVVARQGDA